MAEIRMDAVYVSSEDVVARVIEDELIIVPLAAGVGGEEDELFTLNESGRAIWALLDGHITLQQIVQTLAEEYEAPVGDIERDVCGLMGELVGRGMVVEISA